MLPFCDFTDAKRPTRHPPSDYYMAPVFRQTPFPEVRKLTNKTPAAPTGLAASRHLRSNGTGSVLHVA